MSEDPGESFVIETVLRPTPARGPRTPDPSRYRPLLGAGDDCAWVSPGTVVTTDILVEQIHFDQRLSPADVGWKLVAVNASDVGAMGFRPTWALLTLSLPRPLDRDWVAAFATGLHAALEQWGVSLVGGDTTASPGPVVAGLTLAGAGSRPVTRAGARAGEDLWVTGTLGDAAAGFFGTAPDAPPPAAGLAWLRRPVPPVAFGAALADAGLATAMMDLSDGLARDLPRLCAASGVGAQIDPDALPAGPALEGVADPLPFQVAFGDDYQLLFSAAPGARDAIGALAEAQGVAVARIGACTADRDVSLRGRAWPAPRFAHFEVPA